MSDAQTPADHAKAETYEAETLAARIDRDSVRLATLVSGVGTGGRGIAWHNRHLTKTLTDALILAEDAIRAAERGDATTGEVDALTKRLTALEAE